MTHSSTSEDSVLLHHALRDGDQATFAALMNRYLPLVYSVALRVTGNPSLAAEVGQEVFLKLVQKPDALMKGIPLAAWLHRTTRHRAIDLVRSEKSRAAREREAISLNNPGHEELPGEALALLDEIIDELPSLDRTLVVHRFYLGQSFSVIAARTSMTEDAARIRLHRALEKMRGLFSRRGVATTAAMLSTTLPGQALVMPPAHLLSSVTAKTFAAGALSKTSTFTFIHLMTSTQKYTIAAVSLALAGAVGVSIAQHRDQDTALAKSAAKPPASDAAGPPAAAAPAARNVRAGIPKEDADLAATYGESQVRQAIALSGQIVPMGRQIADLNISANPDFRQLQQDFEKVSAAIGLRPDQKEIFKSLTDKLQESEMARIKRAADRMEQNPHALLETLLAGDAAHNGKITPEAFDAIFASTRPALSEGDSHALDFTGMLMGVGSNPFLSNPDVTGEFLSHLDPGQAESLEKMIKAEPDTSRASMKGSMVFALENLEDYTTQIAGMKKILEAAEIMKKPH